MRRLLQALIASRKLNAGMTDMWVLARSAFDQVRAPTTSARAICVWMPNATLTFLPLVPCQAIHTVPSVDTAAIYSHIWSEYYKFPMTAGNNMGCIFSHMGYSEYAGGYYSYLWSQVYSADMFASRFEKEGIFNPTTGASYRKEILAPGGSRDGMESLKAFLGREPSVEPFLKAKGLAEGAMQNSGAQLKSGVKQA